MELSEQSSDYDLIIEAQKGSESAYRYLVERFQDRCYYLALDVLNNREDALDIAQEAFIRIVKCIQVVDPEKNFFTFLYKITLNLCLDHLRKRKQDKAVNLEDFSHVAGSGQAPDMGMARSEARQRIELVLSALPENYRLVMALRDLQEISYEDIGQALGINYATARWKVHQARKLFREEWERRFGEVGNVITAMRSS